MPKRRKKTGLDFSGLIVLVLLGVLGFGAWKLLPSLTKSNFGNFNRFNMVIVGSEVAVVSMDLTNRTADVVVIPSDLYLLKTVHGYGRYRVGSLYAVGQLDNRGGEVVAGSMREFLGIPIDGYLVASGNTRDIKKFFLSPSSILSSDTNINKLDLIKMVMRLEQIRFDKLKVIELSKIANSLQLPDGSEAMDIDPTSVDDFLQGRFTEEAIVKENLRVEVINTTNYIGLGNQQGRLMSNIGSSVVSVSTKDGNIKGCIIEVVPASRDSATVRRIKGLYGCLVSAKELEGRADLDVYFGEDLVNYLTK